MSLKKWAGFVLALVLVVGFVICFKRFDYFSLNEIKALISVLFGFATSCLLQLSWQHHQCPLLTQKGTASLSFMWLLQNRPIQDAWHLSSPVPIDMPSMNPRGSSNALALGPRRDHHSRHLNHQHQHQHQNATISFISGANDKPPEYKDALLNSKPLCWHHLQPRELDGKKNDLEAGKLGDKALFVSTQTQPRTGGDVSGSGASSKFGGVSPMTFDLVRDIRGSSASLVSQAASAAATSDDACLDQTKGVMPEMSCLDVGLLPVCGSPPKYSELTFEQSRGHVLPNNPTTDTHV